MRFFLLIFSVTFFGNVFAFSGCFNSAGFEYDIDPFLLVAIAITESGLDQSAINHNKDKDGKIISSDHGLFQINDLVWADHFSEMGVDWSDIVNDDCVNIYAGAYVLRYQFNILGKMDWDAVGSYNVGFQKGPKIEKIKARYINLVKNNYLELLDG